MNNQPQKPNQPMQDQKNDLGSQRSESQKSSPQQTPNRSDAQTSERTSEEKSTTNR